MSSAFGSQLRALAEHPQSVAICQRVAAVCFWAAQHRTPEVLSGSAVADLPEMPSLSREEADTPFGNAIEILDRGALGEGEAALLGAAVALFIARSYHADAAPTLEQLRHCVFLAGYTQCNPFLFLDEALLPSQASFWQHVDELFRLLRLPSQLLVAVSLTSATSTACLELKQRWLDTSVQPTLRAALQVGARGVSVLGELRPNRRGPLTLLLQTLCGYLFVRALLRFVVRYLFFVRSRVELWLTPRGLELQRSVSMLGVPLRETQLFIPAHQLQSLSLEKRYQQAAAVLGLFGLGLGTYFGSQLFWSSLRLPGLSPTWLGWGLLACFLGLVFDFLLSSLATHTRGKTCLRIAQRKGAAITLGGIVFSDAEALLRRAAAQHGFRSALRPEVARAASVASQLAEQASSEPPRAVSDSKGASDSKRSDSKRSDSKLPNDSQRPTSELVLVNDSQRPTSQRLNESQPAAVGLTQALLSHSTSPLAAETLKDADVEPQPAAALADPE